MNSSWRTKVSSGLGKVRKYDLRTEVMLPMSLNRSVSRRSNDE